MRDETAVTQPQPETDPQWWRGAVIYQVYPRSFADGNGDGTGDLEGLRQRLPYLRDLGIDAIWVTPWYVSPLADGGYDVADYRAIDPAFGTLARGRAADRRRPRARDPHDHRRRPQPRLRPARVVPGGARRRSRLAGACTVLVPPRQGRERRRDPDQLGLGLPGQHLDAHDEPRRHPRRVVPAPVRAGAAGRQLVAPGRRRRVRGRPALLVRPRRGRHPDRLGRAAHQGPGAARGARAPAAPASTRTSTATSCTTSTAAGGPSPTPTRAPASSSARSGCGTPTGSRSTCVPTRCTRPSTSTSWPVPGTPRSCASRSS